jgi:hypothetical protein
MSGSDEYALLIDLDSREAKPIAETSLADLELLERQNLQAWVEAYPEIIGPDLLLIATEFDQWELHEQRVPDRLDVLMLDKEGHLLVAELKRGTTADTTDLQALKYAAYCANLTVEDVVEMHARYAKIEEAAARSAVIEHAPSLEDSELGPVRVCLLASGFGPSVSSVVLWLNEVGLDIACVHLVARQVDEGRAVMSVRQVLPPPQAKDYLVRRRRRTEVEEQREKKSKKRQTVALLNDHHAVPEETVLQLIPEHFRDDQQKAIEAKLAENASYGRAIWTGKSSRNALRWEHDQEESSPSLIIWRLLEELGFEPTGVHGPYFWRLPTGRSLWEEAESVEAAEKVTEVQVEVGSNGSGGAA